MTGRLPFETLLESLTPEERAEVAVGTARIVADSDRHEALNAQAATQFQSRQPEEPHVAASLSLERTRSRSR